jgi:hypothetical protein
VTLILFLVGEVGLGVLSVREELAPGTGRLVAGVLYGALAVLFVPIRVRVSAYFYEALQAPEPGSDSP